MKAIFLFAILVPTWSWGADIIQAKKEIPIVPGTAYTILLERGLTFFSDVDTIECALKHEARKIPNRRIPKDARFSIVNPQSIVANRFPMTYEDLLRIFNRRGGIAPPNADSGQLIEGIKRLGGVFRDDAAIFRTTFELVSLQSGTTYQVTCEADGPFTYDQIIDRFQDSDAFSFFSNL